MINSFLGGMISGAANAAAPPSTNSHSAQMEKTHSVGQGAIKQASMVSRSPAYRGDPNVQGGGRPPSPIPVAPPSGSGNGGRRELEDRISRLEDRATSKPSQSSPKIGLPTNSDYTSAENRAATNSGDCTIA